MHQTLAHLGIVNNAEGGSRQIPSLYVADLRRRIGIILAVDLDLKLRTRYRDGHSVVDLARHRILFDRLHFCHLRYLVHLAGIVETRALRRRRG